MSFLAGGYFLQESKSAVGRLAEKLPPSASAPGGASAQPSPDVLPEILRHSVPIKGTPPPAEASLSASSRWALPPGGAEAAGLHPDALNPLRSYVSLPQATFGPKRDREVTMQPLSTGIRVGKAFIAATFLVFGGATAVMLYTADKLQLHSVDDVKTKGKDALQPRADMIKEQIAPLRSWAEEMSRKWHFEGNKEAKEKSVIIRELSRALGSRTTPS
ncbi:unnamed protein product [Miscanthus lutarioriparius]|uniref:Uncharacterized protein n=1 Tax=Miscanthus lutarioriparius TaxID=422564 RepID=A0A811NFZ3_9POAL|nr:unnamed protein product [Miscanthus lutarioriparius]